jgi:hypothetical protein
MNLRRITMSKVKLFAKGNSKLSKDVLTFNIPAGMEVCGRECAGCYALKEQKRWKTVEVGRDKRYQLSKEDSFVDMAVEELKKSSPKFVRVHSSGEFYSQEYVDKWVEIAKRLPNLVFYTYTKRKGDFDFSELESLSNFVLHNSYVYADGKKYTNFGNTEYIEKLADSTGGFICPLAKDRTGMCGDSCTWCMEKQNQNTPILFEMH